MIPNDRFFTFDRVVQLALFAGLAWGLVHHWGPIPEHPAPVSGSVLCIGPHQ